VPPATALPLSLPMEFQSQVHPRMQLVCIGCLPADGRQPCDAPRLTLHIGPVYYSDHAIRMPARRMLKAALGMLFDSASSLNKRNIKRLVQDRQYPRICDLGCDDGEWTRELADAAQSSTLFGIEIVPTRAAIAASRGIQVTIADLNSTFPFADESFDLVHANQVIEHLSDIDHFLAEIRRVLRIGGTAIISTENGSSWHNVFAAAMGWQTFSLTNFSTVALGVGNPLAVHRGGRLKFASSTHKIILNYRGLIEILDLHQLRLVRMAGAGYHPLPPEIGRIDNRHAHFMAAKAVKTRATNP
jgi:SAM-dependent methyltransferase